MNLAGVFALIMRAGAVLKIGKILWNLPKIIRFVRTFKEVAKDLFASRRLPTSSESEQFLLASADLVRAQIIDFPGIDEDQLAEKLEEFAAEVLSETTAELKEAA